MSYKVKYANLDLDKYIKILNVKRTILPPRENFTKNIPALHGEYYMGYKYAPKKISLECILKANSKEEFVDNLKDLSFILDVKAPSKLIIDDSPDRFCFAVIDGEIDVEKVAHNNGKFDLEFVCYDPITYSIDSDYFYDEGNHKLTIQNSGTTDAYPILSVAFTNPAFFFQCTNNDNGETILVGTPSDVNKKPYEFNPVVLRDDCSTLTGWSSIGNIVDNAIVNGNLSINAGGYGIYCNNYGSNDAGWHGGGLRKNFSAVQDFKVQVKMEYNSLGDLKGSGAGSTPPVTENPNTPTVKYKVTAEPSLRIRDGRGTNFKQIGSIPKNTVVDVSEISSGWGKTTYNGVTGYISMDYLVIYNTDSQAPSPSASYKVNASPSLRMRSGRGTNYKQVGSIPNGKIITVTEIEQNWGKTTYGGKTGYVSMQYAIKQNTTKQIGDVDFFENGSAEENIGRLEVYGFDRDGVKLFKMCMSDTSEFYEYSEPSIEIGSKLVLDDNKKVPAPKTITEKEGDKDVVKPVESGAFGEWNDFSGWFTIERKTVGDVQQWSCKIEKLNSSGNVTTTLATGNLSNSSYPKGALTNVVIFIGGHKSNLPVEVMNINEINVDNIGTPPKPEENKPIFLNGDELVVDFNTQKIYKKGFNFMKELDIGSQFFACPVGETKITCRSEDKNMNVIASLQKRWI